MKGVRGAKSPMSQFDKDFSSARIQIWNDGVFREVRGTGSPGLFENDVRLRYSVTI